MLNFQDLAGAVTSDTLLCTWQSLPENILCYFGFFDRAEENLSYAHCLCLVCISSIVFEGCKSLSHHFSS